MIPVAVAMLCDITREGLLHCIPAAGGEVLRAGTHVAALNYHVLWGSAAIVITEAASLDMAARLIAADPIPLLVIAQHLTEGLASVNHPARPSVMAMPLSMAALTDGMTTLASGERFVPTSLRSPFAGTSLSVREQEVLCLDMQMLDSAGIAAQLHLTVSTLRQHRQNIADKLQLSGRTPADIRRRAEQLWRRTWHAQVPER